MKPEIVIYLNRQELKLFYSQNESPFRNYSLNDQPNIPLYFIAESNNFELGYKAKVKYSEGNPNHFKEYFDSIRNTKAKFSYLGQEYNLGFLLVKAVEYLLTVFAHEIEIENIHINEIKEKYSLNLVFDLDIDDNEINYTCKLFEKSGFVKLRALRHDYLVLNYMDQNREITALKSFILVTGLSTNLILSYYTSLQEKFFKFKKSGEGLAINPEDELVARILFEQTAMSTNSRTSEKDELPALIELAKKHRRPRSEYDIFTKLSDGSSKRVIIQKRVIDQKLSRISSAVDAQFVEVAANGQDIPISQIGIVVFGEIHSKVFVEKLHTFSNHVFIAEHPMEDYFNQFINDSEVINKGDFLNLEKSNSNKAKAASNLSNPPKSSIKVPEPTPVRSKSTTPPPATPRRPLPPPPRPTNTKTTTPPPPPPRRPLPPPPPPANTRATKSTPPPVKKSSVASKAPISPAPAPRKAPPPPIARSSASPPPLPTKKTGPPPLPKKSKK